MIDHKSSRPVVFKTVMKAAAVKILATVEDLEAMGYDAFAEDSRLRIYVPSLKSDGFLCVDFYSGEALREKYGDVVLVAVYDADKYRFGLCPSEYFACRIHDWTLADLCREISPYVSNLFMVKRTKRGRVIYRNIRRRHHDHA